MATAPTCGVALYDFDAQNGDELSLREGETVTVVQYEVCEGWSTVLNYNGQQGIVPTSYMELQVTNEYSPISCVYDMAGTDTRFSRPAPTESHEINNQQSVVFQESSWPTRNTEYDLVEESTFVDNIAGRSPSSKDVVAQVNVKDVSEMDAQHVREVREAALIALRCLPRTNYVKEFLMDELPTKSTATATPFYIDADGRWQATSGPYHCTLTNVRKESKLRGLTSTIVYQVCTSFSHVPVQRYENQFDWLHAQLNEKFGCVAVIPPLPTASAARRGGLEQVVAVAPTSETAAATAAAAIENINAHLLARAGQLQLWLNRVALHPILSSSDALKLFLTCGDEKNWKEGRRIVEKDEWRAGFLLMLVMPQALVDWSKVEINLEISEKYMKSSERAVRDLVDTMIEHGIKQQKDYRKNFMQLGRGFAALSKATAQDPDKLAPALVTALRGTAEAYKNCANIMQRQHMRETDAFVDKMGDYGGLLTQFPSTMQLRRASVQIARDSQRGILSGEALANTLRDRAAVIYACTDAELRLYQDRCFEDYRAVTKNVLIAQIQLAKEITSELENAMGLYTSC